MPYTDKAIRGRGNGGIGGAHPIMAFSVQNRQVGQVIFVMRSKNKNTTINWVVVGHCFGWHGLLPVDFGTGVHTER